MKRYVHKLARFDMIYVSPATGKQTETKFLSKTEVLRQAMELLRELDINEITLRKYEP